MIIPVQTSSGNYQIRMIHHGILQLPQILLEIMKPRPLILAANPLVYELYGKQLQHSLEKTGFSVYFLRVPDGEKHKNMQSYLRLLEELDATFVDRKTPLIALGGGVTGDLAGFVAATLLRGIPLIQVPTTLLSMVDSSIGGKVGVNTSNGKNRAGAFYPPAMVIIATEVLQTLPAEEFRCGLGEVIKHGLLGDESILRLCEEHPQEILNASPQIVTDLIAKNCLVKSAIVSQDEREKGTRALLNFGHTVGHALEAALAYKSLKHGECVALGLLAEMSWAVEYGSLSPSTVDRVKKMMLRLGMALTIPPVSLEELLHHVQFDKKLDENRLSLTLLHDIGHAELVPVHQHQLPTLFHQLLELKS